MIWYVLLLLVHVSYCYCCWWWCYFCQFFTEMFFKIDALKNSAVFLGKHLCWRLFSMKLLPWRLAKKRLQHRSFLVNIAKFLRTPFFTEHLRQLLLFISDILLFTGLLDFYAVSEPNHQVHLIQFLEARLVPKLMYTLLFVIHTFFRMYFLKLLFEWDISGVETIHFPKFESDLSV